MAERAHRAAAPWKRMRSERRIENTATSGPQGRCGGPEEPGGLLDANRHADRNPEGKGKSVEDSWKSWSS